MRGLVGVGTPSWGGVVWWCGVVVVVSGHAFFHLDQEKYRLVNEKASFEGMKAF